MARRAGRGEPGRGGDRHHRRRGRAARHRADKLIHLHGYAKGADRLPTERPDLSRSAAMEAVLSAALTAAGKTTAEIAHFDLYSCFPVAVLLAAEAIGLDWRTTPATITGGLPFFGGAGNNYSMHAIATMVERLRARPTNSASSSPTAVSCRRKRQASIRRPRAQTGRWCRVPRCRAGLDAQVAPPLLGETTDAVVETYTVTSPRASRRAAT